MPRTLLVLLCLLITTVPAFADDERVGSFGDPKRWQIHGLQSLDPEKVLRRLSVDFPVLLAAHPQAPSSKFPSVLEHRLLLGLQHAGFRDARVTVQIDREKGIVNINVTEGVRLGSGKVVVTGIEGEIADSIVSNVTASELNHRDATPTFDSGGNVLSWAEPDDAETGEQKVRWKGEDPAPFDDYTLRKLNEQTQQALEDAGYSLAKLDVSLVQREQLADLHIQITDLGPPSVLESIEIDGNVRDSDDEIVNYLGVRRGERLTSRRRVELTRSLWESGRFAEQKVHLKSNSAGTMLRITVVESSGAPRLNDPLPRHTLALLKCRNWITAGEGQDRDLVITSAGATNSWEIIASRDGALLSLKSDGESDRLPEYAMTLAKNGISLFEIQQHRKLLSVKPSQLLKLTVGMSAIRNPQDGRRYSSQFGIGFSGSSDQGPLLVKTSLDPSYFVTLGGDPEVRAHWDDDVLALSTANGSLRINSRSGEFLGYRGTDFNLQLVANRFKKRRDELMTATSNHPNHFDPALPVSSVLGFLSNSTAIADLCERFEIPEPTRSQIVSGQTWLRSLADRDLFRPADKWVSNGDSGSDAKTGIRIPPFEPVPTGYWQIMGVYVIPIAEHLFPRDSWPWSVWRETAFSMAGDSRYFTPELSQVILSGKMGPLGHWVLVELFSRLGAQEMTAYVAQLGLGTPLYSYKFRDDCKLLLGNAWPSVISTVRWLGNLSEEELDAIAKVISVDRASLQKIRDSVGTSSDEEAPRAILAALEELWINQWSHHYETRMREVLAAQAGTARTATDDKSLR